MKLKLIALLTGLAMCTTVTTYAYKVNIQNNLDKPKEDNHWISVVLMDKEYHACNSQILEPHQKSKNFAIDDGEKCESLQSVVVYHAKYSEQEAGTAYFAAYGYNPFVISQPEGGDKDKDKDAVLTPNKSMSIVISSKIEPDEKAIKPGKMTGTVGPYKPSSEPPKKKSGLSHESHA